MHPPLKGDPQRVHLHLLVLLEGPRELMLRCQALPIYDVLTPHGHGGDAHPEVPAVLRVPLKGTPLFRASSSRGVHLPRATWVVTFLAPPILEPFPVTSVLRPSTPKGDPTMASAWS